MRPTASSASKTHDKPASPPHKATTKAPVGVLQKGKKKVEEVASKAKDAVTNGHHDDDDHHDAADDNVPNEASTEPIKAATPVQEADSSTAELQTPHFEGETLR